ncbi:MAG TPA: imidazole glycerol phosphate synthase subunit HisH [Candidatus Omnitrophota bacterium]|nr:imidazole glycerol phosphate synthase subunit HisH [Candidatus Omnitrophota bacterium]HPS37131.1 imidazole glycerol phosphate synthase subunit HisH [Candidatus Omnitrophota bacterium]
MIAIIDYGMGNLRSVSKALESLGAKCRICTRGKDLACATQVILPGVGAFGDAMKELKARGFLDPVRELVARKAKLMGVCLGLQLLFEKSEEASGAKGLGILKGSVVKFRSKNVKVPHMGWNDLRILKKHPLLDGITNGDYFYFVHTYYAKPASRTETLASCHYGKEDFSAVVGNGHVFAAQFHPEKSQEAGLRILKNFIRWGA